MGGREGGNVLFRMAYGLEECAKRLRTLHVDWMMRIFKGPPINGRHPHQACSSGEHCGLSEFEFEGLKLRQLVVGYDDFRMLGMLLRMPQAMPQGMLRCLDARDA
eukprot:scaffold363_cov255-Pinguiococcus_pyrenoidosus.AAC.3